jgi:hypothetical protein
LSLPKNIPIIIIDGEQYIKNNLKGWENKLVRVYSLNDGSKWTARMVADKLGAKCTNSCARARLNNHDDPEQVFRPLRYQKPREDRFVPPDEMLNPQDWWTDPMIKLLMRSIGGKPKTK